MSPVLGREVPISWFALHSNGKRTMFTSSAALYGAAMLDQEGAPELTQEQFGEPNQDPAGGRRGRGLVAPNSARP